MTCPDIDGAVHGFILDFGVSGSGPLEADRIWRGLQNRIPVPAGSGDYAVYTLQSVRRRGTNREVYDWENETLALCAHRIAEIKVSFYSQDGSAMERALCLETVARSECGTEFFRNRGLNVLMASDPQDVKYTDDSSQYRRLAELTLTLEFDTVAEFERTGAEGPLEPHIEDVDAHHPPRRT